MSQNPSNSESQSNEIRMDFMVKQESLIDILNLMWERKLLPELLQLFGRLIFCPTDLVTQSLAARIKGCSVKTIQYHVKNGALPVYTQHSFVSRGDVINLQLRKDAGQKRATYKKKSKANQPRESEGGLPTFTGPL